MQCDQICHEASKSSQMQIKYRKKVCDVIRREYVVDGKVLVKNRRSKSLALYADVCKIKQVQLEYYEADKWRHRQNALFQSYYSLFYFKRNRKDGVRLYKWRVG